MDRGVWWAAVLGVAKSWTPLSVRTSRQYGPVGVVKIFNKKETFEVVMQPRDVESIQMRNEKTGLPRTFPLPVLPQNNLSAKPYSFKTFKTLLKTHIFHEAFPDSHCLYSIILITLITLAKVIVGCIYVYETRFMPILCCKLPEDREAVLSLLSTD